MFSREIIQISFLYRILFVQEKNSTEKSGFSENILLHVEIIVAFASEACSQITHRYNILNYYWN